MPVYEKEQSYADSDDLMEEVKEPNESDDNYSDDFEETMKTSKTKHEAMIESQKRIIAEKKAS